MASTVSPGRAASRPGASALACGLVGLLLGPGCATRTVPPVVPAGFTPASSPVFPRSAGALASDGRLYVHDRVERAARPPLAVVDLERGVALGDFVAHVAATPDRFDLALALAPSATMVASLRGRKDEVLVWQPRTRALVGRVRTAGGAEVLAFAFTPDERSLMLATAAGLERRALRDGRREAAWDLPGVRAFAAVPGRAEWLVAVERPQPALLRLRDDRRPRRIAIPGVAGVEHLRISPDGRWLAVAAWGAGADENLHVWDLAARRELALAVPREAVNALEFSPDGRLLVASLGAPCVAPGVTHLVAWDLARAQAVVDVPLALATALRVTAHEVLAAQADNVVRIALPGGETTALLPATCEPPCGLVVCA